MAYEKQNWKTGDVVTSAKLNHMEDGIAGGYLIITATRDTEAMTLTLDKTWSEIKTALDAKIPCFIYSTLVGDEDYGTDLLSVIGAYYMSTYDNPYNIIDINQTNYLTTTPDGYPVNSYD